ncbi:RHS repeat-associated core domain-containing protein, partial [Paraburkholderia oxyphila]|uniref:RHS repeat-associated core domain-containing protein n=1 Tax=Paraburkholderia oxyphila TaxID=614212 RepID=UPI0005B85F72
GLGRFLQTDPVGYADDLNLYAYVKNNPINLTDPSGLIASASGNFASNTTAPATTPKLDTPAFSMPATSAGNQAAVQVAAAGDLKCQGFSAGCQNGGSYGSTGAYKVNGLILCTSCAVKMLGVENESPAEKAITLELYINKGSK